MKNTILSCLFIFFLSVILDAQTLSPFELDPERNTSATYRQTIDFYQELATNYPNRLQLQEHGLTDSGFPLHLVILSNNGLFDPVKLQAQNKIIIFINNAIHPGEPCGVDASMLLVRDYLEKPNEFELPDDVVLAIIPFYNISGGLNRDSYSRTNQNGPKEYGFRGNIQHLDLNRDFIKCDSRNAQAFNQVYTAWDPEIFIDNHTSNGADYQYTLTLIPTQHNKLSAPLADYLQNQMLPYLYKDLAKRGWEMTPYVYARDIPDNGIAGFLDLPRYSSGYAALHHALSFTQETHMLKPFKDRVESVYQFMQSMVVLANKDKKTIQQKRKEAITKDMLADSLDINWTLDFIRADTIQFKGYEAAYKPSEISGLDRLYYNQDKPFTKPIPFYNYYRTTTKIKVPRAYIIPQAYQDIINRLRWNGVSLYQFQNNRTFEVEHDYIDTFKTTSPPYEGHYLHSGLTINKIVHEWSFQKGDYLVLTDQEAVRYIVETLEPQAPDSYFSWNFFDAILQQKEYFSSYVFEDLALKYLEADPELSAALEKKKQTDETFAKDARAQLNFVYKNSPHYENTHNLYPVARLWIDGNIY